MISDEESDVDNEKSKPDEFLDRDIDFDFEVTKAILESQSKSPNRVEWSGQDIKIEFDPYFANTIIRDISGFRVLPYWPFGMLARFRGWITNIIHNQYFENLMMLIVAINVVVLSFERYGISESASETLSNLNFMFSIIFIIELVLKLIDLGPIQYLQDKMNYIDGVVVIMIVFELTIFSEGTFTAFRVVKIIRTLRVLRVARILKSMQSMQIIIEVISKSVSSFFYLFMLLLLFIFIYTLLGMQLFGGSFNFKDGIPRSNFDSFNSAFITVFQLLTMEGWQEVLYDWMRSEVNNIISIIYLLSWIFLGNYMLINLILAIIMHSFSEEDNEITHFRLSKEEIKKNEIEEQEAFMQKSGEELILHYAEEDRLKRNQSKLQNLLQRKKVKVRKDIMMNATFEINTFVMSKHKSLDQSNKSNYKNIECVRSLYLFHYNNIIRKICYKITNHYLFENIVLSIIILSSIKLAYDTYLYNVSDNDTRVIVSRNFDAFFTFFFLFEALVKWISIGFVQDKGSYLRESWNWLDFFIVIVSIFDYSFEGINIPIIKILRTLRTLRPLRFISFNTQLKL